MGKDPYPIYRELHASGQRHVLSAAWNATVFFKYSDVAEILRRPNEFSNGGRVVNHLKPAFSAVAEPDPDVALLLAHLGLHLPKGSKLVQNVVEKNPCKSTQVFANQQNGFRNCGTWANTVTPPGDGKQIQLAAEKLKPLPAAVPRFRKTSVEVKYKCLFNHGGAIRYTFTFGLDECFTSLGSRPLICLSLQHRAMRHSCS